MIETPQSFVVAEFCRQAAWQNGYRRPLGEEQGWAGFGSTTAKGTIRLGAAGQNGPWYLALDHAGVVEELQEPRANLPGPGLARYTFGRLAEVYPILQQVYRLGASLPDAPLQAFHAAIRSLPSATETERLIVQRIGQDIFRESLLAYWQACCPLTGITDAALLRASHIIPWAICETDAERLDVHNGLLLSALWDAAFDNGLVSFADDGSPLLSPRLGGEATSALKANAGACIKLTAAHRERLVWHRSNLFQA